MELKELLEYRKRYYAPGEDPKILALGLSSRKNLCIHPRVSGARAGGRALRLAAGCCCCWMLLLQVAAAAIMSTGQWQWHWQCRNC